MGKCSRPHTKTAQCPTRKGEKEKQTTVREGEKKKETTERERDKKKRQQTDSNARYGVNNHRTALYELCNNKVKDIIDTIDYCAHSHDQKSLTAVKDKTVSCVALQQYEK